MRGKRITGLTLGLGTLTLLLVAAPNAAWASDNSKNLTQSLGGQLNQPVAATGALDLTALESITMNTSSSQTGALPLAPSAGSFILAAQSAAAEVGNDAGVITLETITVEAARPDWESILSPGTVDVVIPDNYAGEQKKLPEYLEMVPGLHINRRGGDGQFSTLTIRGSTSAQVNIYVDGVPQNTGGDAGVDLSLIPVENVARIEVYRGYIPARFAGAPLGGVINIVTKKPAGFGGRAAVGISSFDGRRGDLTVTGPLFSGSLLLGVHHDQSEGDFKYKYMDKVGDPPPLDNNGNPLPTTRWRQSNSYKNTDVLLKWQDENWQVKGAWKKTDRYYPMSTNFGGSALTSAGSKWVDLNGLAGLDLSQYPNDGPGNLALLQQLDKLSEHRKQEVEQYDFTLGRRQQMGNLEWGVEAFYSHQKKDYYIDNLPDWYWDRNLWGGVPVAQLWTKYKNERAGISLDGTYNLGDRHLLEFRVDYSHEEQTQDANRLHSKEGGGFTHFYDDGGIAYNAKYKMLDKYTRKLWHAQLSDTITLGEDDDMWLTVIGRWDQAKDNVDVPDTNTDGIGTWGVALKKEINPNWTFRASWGSFVRYPNFYELYGDGVYVMPIDLMNNSYTRPTRETGNQWDVGLDWRGDLFKADSKLSATWFNRRTHNMIGPSYRPDGTMFYVNRGDVEAWGLEAEGSFNWDRVGFDLSGTWLPRANQRMLHSPTGGVIGEFGARLPYQPEWEGHGRINIKPLEDKSLTVFAEHHYTGKMVEPINAAAAGAALAWRKDLNVTNIGLRYDSPWGFQLTAGINDIMDNRNEQTFSFANGGNSYGIPFPSPGRTWYVSLEYLFGGGEKPSPAEVAARSPTAGWRKAAASASGEVSGKKSPWYIAPKLIYTQQKAKISDTNWSMGKGHVDNSGKRQEALDNAASNAEYAWTNDGWDSMWDFICGMYGYGPGKDEFIRWNVDQVNDMIANDPQLQDGYGALASDYGPLPALQGVAKNDSFFGGALAVGVDLYNIWEIPVRLELEASTHFDGLLIDAGQTNMIHPETGANLGPYFATLEYRIHSAFFNTYLDWRNESIFTPYIGGGVGASMIKVDYLTGGNGGPGGGTRILESKKSTNLAWHATVGVSCPITDNVALDLSYRYVNWGFKERLPRIETVSKSASDPNPDNYLSTASYGRPEIDLTRADQVLMSLRFSF